MPTDPAAPLVALPAPSTGQPADEPLPATPPILTGAVQVQHWIDTSTRDGQAMLNSCLNGDCLGYEQVAGQILPLVSAVGHTVQIADHETGEVVSAVRTVLVLADGRKVAFISTGIQSSIAKLLYSFGRPPWTPPVAIRIYAKPARMGKVYLIDTPPVGDDEGPAGAGPKKGGRHG